MTSVSMRSVAMGGRRLAINADAAALAPRASDVCFFHNVVCRAWKPRHIADPRDLLLVGSGKNLLAEGLPRKIAQLPHVVCDQPFVRGEDTVARAEAEDEQVAVAKARCIVLEFLNRGAAVGIYLGDRTGEHCIGFRRGDA